MVQPRVFEFTLQVSVAGDLAGTLDHLAEHVFDPDRHPGETFAGVEENWLRKLVEQALGQVNKETQGELVLTLKGGTIAAG